MQLGRRGSRTRAPGSCLDCRRLHDALRDGLAAVRELPVYAPPASVWSGMCERWTGKNPRRHRRSMASARCTTSRSAVAGLKCAGGGRRARRRCSRSSRPARSHPATRWACTSRRGPSSSRGSAVGRHSNHRRTVAARRRRVARDRCIIARATVHRNARQRGRRPRVALRLVQAGGVERALRIERGSIDARVWAPPRFFLVETPAATAVDLGCIYSLDVDEHGNGILRVRSGQVELRGHGRDALVVAGTVAEMRRGAGPGTPYMAGENEVFRQALAVVDFGGGERDRAIDEVLSLATSRSTITLWHLLSRVSGERAVTGVRSIGGARRTAEGRHARCGAGARWRRACPLPCRARANVVERACPAVEACLARRVVRGQGRMTPSRVWAAWLAANVIPSFVVSVLLVLAGAALGTDRSVVVAYVVLFGLVAYTASAGLVAMARDARSGAVRQRRWVGWTIVGSRRRHVLRRRNARDARWARPRATRARSRAGRWPASCWGGAGSGARCVGRVRRRGGWSRPSRGGPAPRPRYLRARGRGGRRSRAPP